MDFDFSKLSLIQNEFGAHWIHIIGHTRDVQNELLFVLYLNIYVGHDKKHMHTYLGLFKVYTTVYECTC